jgi:hypothetical protein
MTDAGINIDTEAFSRDVAQFALLTGRTFGDELKQQAKGVLKNILKVTPPFNGGGGSVATAKRAAEGAIHRDLGRIFRPVALVGSRKITHLFGKPHPSAPWTVPTPEKHPQLASLYAAHKKLDSRSRQARYKNAYFVDELKYKALVDKIMKRSGRLGGGFAAAAAELHVPIPAFMSRHRSSDVGASGIRMQLDGDNLFIIITNDVPYAPDVEGFVRRFNWAVETQRGKMERQMPYLLKRHERLLN